VTSKAAGTRRAETPPSMDRRNSQRNDRGSDSPCPDADNCRPGAKERSVQPRRRLVDHQHLWVEHLASPLMRAYEWSSLTRLDRRYHPAHHVT
jgi:hypothetical protein